MEATRRKFLGSGALLAWSLVGCQKREFSCNEATGLNPADKVAREASGYADRTADPKRSCATCQQWEPGSDDGCGRCKIVRGPIHPLGTCKLFAARS